MPKGCPPIVVAVAAGVLLLAPASAAAAPVTVNFESGATVGAVVTNQYGPPGTPAGPTFMRGTEAGFTGVHCPAPHLSNSYKAHSGENELKLDGCEGGEFWPSDGFFTLGYTTEKIEFWVASDTPAASSTVTTTAFNASGTLLSQIETTVPASSEPLYERVVIESAGGDIASVAVQLGRNWGTEPNSSTGVTEGAGNTDLLLDDLTYYPPTSPPGSSFRLGANPSAVATTAGNQVEVTIPVIWTNNPEPGSTPVEFEATTPAGVEASFSPKTSTSLSTTMTLKIAKSAIPEQTSVTVTGYVERNKPGQKTASIEIPLGISAALELSGVENLTLAPCTPRQLHLRVLTPSYLTEPVTIEVITANQPSVTITSISNGQVLQPWKAKATVTPSGGEAAVTVGLSVPPGAKPAQPAVWLVSAYAGEYAEARMEGKLAVEAGAIEAADFGTGSTAATTVETPALHRPGSQVTLHGAGFCAGTSVAIGDDLEGTDTESLATPESISSDGRSLTFRVPRGAVSGAVKALPPGEPTVEGPTLGVRSFRNTLGFSWLNHDYGMRLDDELGDELFGKDETNIEPIPGWLVRKPEAVLFEEMTNKHIPGGICFGIAYTSLEFSDFPGEISRFPRTGGNDPWHMDSPSMPSEPLLRQVTENFSLQFTDQLIPAEVNAVLGIHGTNDDINTIEEELAAGHPVLLGLIHFGNLLEGGSVVEGHTVLAYDTRQLSGGRTAVYVLNSNVPYSTQEESNFEQHNSSQFTRSEVIVKEGNWEFPEGAEFEHSGGKPWTGSEAGMVVYRHHELPIINGERPHLPNLLTAVLMSFGSSADGVTQLSDGHGSLISGNQLAPPASWPKGVAPLPNFNSRSSPLQLVSVNPKTAGPLTATVARSSGGGAMSFNLPGLQANLQSGAGTNQVDKITVDPRTDTLGYATSAAHSPLGGTLLSAPGAAAASSAAGRSALSDRLAQFHLVSAHNGGERVSFPHGKEFVLVHKGAPTAVSLTLSAFASNGQPIAVQLPSARLGAGQTLRVAPLNWSRLASTPVRVTTSGGGRHPSLRLVRGHSLARAFASVRRAALVALGAGTSRLDLALHMRHAPKDGRLSVAASVLKRGRLVARAKANQLSGSLARVRSLDLLIPKRLAPGPYTVALRLLEVTANGPAQGSVVVTKTLPARASG